MRYAICNELFTDPTAVGGDAWSWPQQCEFSRSLGYEGIEVAPFTLGSTPIDISAAERDAMRKVAEEAGLEVIGLHWLLAKTEGYHLTTADADVRRRTGEYLASLADLCADLGGNVMVLGSPQQRNLETGLTYAEAEENAIDTLRGAVETFEERGVTLCLEPLGPNETDFMRTCASARPIIEAIGSPSVMLHQDVKAMLHEETPVPTLIEQFADVTRHFHANDANLRGPGMGDVDYHPIFEALQRTAYNGYVSVEVFDYAPGAEATARQSIEYMKHVEASVIAGS